MFKRHYQSPTGSIEVSFASPIESEGRWFCELQIITVTLEDIAAKGWGVDPLDALLRAIDLAKIFLESFEDDGISVEWLGDKDLGLSLR